MRGTLSGYTGNETGVVVNGTVADIYENRFLANNVSLVEGVNTITAAATNTARNTASSPITVTAVTTGNWLELSSNIRSGVAPLTVNFSIFSSGFAPTLFQMDFEGDGITDYEGGNI